LLVGYKNNKKTAVYHSQLFTKYIISWNLKFIYKY
jgi:hypothetical protein